MEKVNSLSRHGQVSSGVRSKFWCELSSTYMFAGSRGSGETVEACWSLCCLPMHKCQNLVC